MLKTNLRFPQTALCARQAARSLQQQSAARPRTSENDMQWNPANKDEAYQAAHTRFSTDGNPTLPHDKMFKGEWQKDPAFRASEEYVNKRKTSAQASFDMNKNYTHGQTATQGLGKGSDPNPNPVTQSAKNLARDVKQSMQRVTSKAEQAMPSPSGGVEQNLDQAKREVSDLGQKAAQQGRRAVDRLEDKAEEAAQAAPNAASMLHDAKERGEHIVHEVQDKAEHLAHEAKEKVEHMLPDTAEGDSLLSKAKSQVKNAAEAIQNATARVLHMDSSDRAAEQGRHVAEKASDKVEQMTERGRHEASKLGNRVESAASNQSDAKRLADDAKEEGRHAAKQAANKASEWAEEGRHAIKDTLHEAEAKGDDVMTKVEDGLSSAKETIKDKAGELKDKASELYDDAAEKVQEGKHEAKDKAEDLAEAAKQKGNQAKHQAQETAGRVESEAAETGTALKNKAKQAANAMERNFEEASDKVNDSFGDNVTDQASRIVDRAAYKAARWGSKTSSGLKQQLEGTFGDLNMDQRGDFRQSGEAGRPRTRGIREGRDAMETESALKYRSGRVPQGTVQFAGRDMADRHALMQRAEQQSAERVTVEDAFTPSGKPLNPPEYAKSASAPKQDNVEHRQQYGEDGSATDALEQNVHRDVERAGTTSRA